MLVHKKQDWLYEGNAALTIPQREQKPSKKDELKINKSLRSKCLVLVLTIAFLSAIVTMQSAYIVKSGYDVVEMKQQILRTERANETLRLDIANLKTPERIASIASQKIGMIVSQNAYFSSGSSSYQAGIIPESSDRDTAQFGLFNFNGQQR